MKKRTRILSCILSIFLLLFSLPLEPLFVEAESGTDNVTTFSYTGGVQTYVVPEDGLYKLEVAGASGGTVETYGTGGNGGVSIGYKELSRGDEIFIVVGGKGGTSSRSWGLAGGGYNGGGNGKGVDHVYWWSGGGGGGATHMAWTNRGVLSNYDEYRTDLLIVAGGGGGGDANWENGTYYGQGGAGNASASTSTFGQGASLQNTNGVAGGGGGGGYYGGYATSGESGRGGSGYVGATPAVTLNGRTYKPSMQSGANSGNGYAKITYIPENDDDGLGDVPDIGSYQDFGYTGGVQTYTVPADGIYKLECYGASGGTVETYGTGGNGGISIGYKELSRGDEIFIVVGGKGGTSSRSWGLAGGGYNGGGNGKGVDHVYWWSGGGGGGATHMATLSGTLPTLADNADRILIVAGGGGGGDACWMNGTYYGQGGAGNASASTSTIGQGASLPTINGYAGGGGGGGYYGGYATSGESGKGGSGYVDACPEITVNGETYTPSLQTGGNSGNGKARITFIAKSLRVTLPAYTSYTERDHYSLSAPVVGVLSYKWQIMGDSDTWVDLYDSEVGIFTENIPEGFEDVSFTESIVNGNGTISIAGTANSSFDGKKLRAVVTGENESVSSETSLQITHVDRSARSVVGHEGETADFSFTVHGAESAALQVRTYGADIWEAYVPTAGVVNNPITTTSRDGEVTFHFASLTEDDLKRYYRIVLTNDGSGLISDEIFLTSCIYNLNYDDDAVEIMMYDESDVLSVYYNAGTDNVLVYGFEQ